MTGTTIILSPPDQPRITSVSTLLSTPCVSVLIEIPAGRLDNFDRGVADNYLAAGSYIILVFEDIADAVKLQRSAHAAARAQIQ